MSHLYPAKATTAHNRQCNMHLRWVYRGATLHAPLSTSSTASADAYALKHSTQGHILPVTTHTALSISLAHMQTIQGIGILEIMNPLLPVPRLISTASVAECILTTPHPTTEFASHLFDIGVSETQPPTPSWFVLQMKVRQCQAMLDEVHHHVERAVHQVRL